MVLKEDSEWIREVLGDSVIDFVEIESGHLSFFVGKDQSYFLDNALKHI